MSTFRLTLLALVIATALITWLFSTSLTGNRVVVTRTDNGDIVTTRAGNAGIVTGGKGNGDIMTSRTGIGNNVTRTGNKGIVISQTRHRGIVTGNQHVVSRIVPYEGLVASSGDIVSSHLDKSHRHKTGANVQSKAVMVPGSKEHTVGDGDVNDSADRAQQVLQNSHASYQSSKVDKVFSLQTIAKGEERSPGYSPAVELHKDSSHLSTQGSPQLRLPIGKDNIKYLSTLIVKAYSTTLPSSMGLHPNEPRPTPIQLVTTPAVPVTVSASMKDISAKQHKSMETSYISSESSHTINTQGSVLKNISLSDSSPVKYTIPHSSLKYNSSKTTNAQLNTASFQSNNIENHDIRRMAKLQQNYKVTETEDTNTVASSSQPHNITEESHAVTYQLLLGEERVSYTFPGKHKDVTSKYSIFHSYKEALRQRAIEKSHEKSRDKQYVIIVVVDSVHTDMAINMYEVSLLEHGLNNYLFLCMDHMVCTTLHQLHISAYPYANITTIQQNTHATQPEVPINTSDIYAMLRTRAVLEALHHNVSVLVLDVDVVLFRDPYPAFSCLGCDIHIAYDGVSRY